MYVDGVPQGNVFSYGSELYDIQDIEVLRGPRGYRFGKLAAGGAIYLRTQKAGQIISSLLSHKSPQASVHILTYMAMIMIRQMVPESAIIFI